MKPDCITSAHLLWLEVAKLEVTGLKVSVGQPRNRCCVSHAVVCDSAKSAESFLSYSPQDGSMAPNRGLHCYDVRLLVLMSALLAPCVLPAPGPTCLTDRMAIGLLTGNVVVKFIFKF